MFSILFSKELWTSVNVLAQKPINKFIRVILPVILKLRRIKKIGQNVCVARLLRWNIWEGTFWKLGGKLAWQHFLALNFETMKRRKIHQRGYRKKNITCEIRCLLLHLNVPSVVCFVEKTFVKLAWQHFLALYFETMKRRKIHQRGYRKKNITCEIRCLLLHLNVPSVVLYWLLDA